MRKLGINAVAALCLMAGPVGSILAADVSTKAGQPFAIDWYLMGSGGTQQAKGNTYALRGSIGQAVAGTSASATHSLDAGFWYGVPPGCSDCIFINGFESEQ